MTSIGTHYSYDEVPYPDLCYVQTHPDRLGMLGTLLGMTPAPVEKCHVLEIGCANGGNLIPMAFGLPESSFVGIDQSAVQIGHAQAAVTELQLSNISFQPIDMMDIGTDFGMFDYIIAHGIYSWVPPEVQEKLLDICKQNLAPQGIAYVSYNTYPGWHTVDVIRNMMLYRTRDITDPAEKSRLAREWIAFMKDALSDSTDSAYAALFNTYLQYRSTNLAEFDHAALLHDELEEFNVPLYFHQFVERAERHGLQYLAEADFPTVMPNGLRPDVVEHLVQTARTTIEMEQYLDFVRNRSFRRTLLCHENVSVNRQLGINPIQNFYVTSEAKPLPVEAGKAPPGAERFGVSDRVVFGTDHPVTKAAFHCLIEAAPHPLRFDALLKAACARLQITQPNRQDAVTLAANLLQAFTYSLELIEFRLHAPSFVTEVSERPMSSRLARFQAQSGTMIASPLHKRVELDAFTRTVLLTLDGQHDRTSIFDFLLGLAEQGKIHVLDGEQAAGSMERIREVLTHELDYALQWLAQAALLTG